MAIGGGGSGGGGPGGVSNSFTGTANTIEKVSGKWWGGWNGLVTVSTSNSPVTMYDFLSPNKALLMHFTYCVNDANLGDGNTIGFQILMNGTIVATVQDNSGEARSLGTLSTPLDIMIPPSTEVVIQGITNNSSDINVSGIIVAEET